LLGARGGGKSRLFAMHENERMGILDCGAIGQKWCRQMHGVPVFALEPSPYPAPLTAPFPTVMKIRVRLIAMPLPLTLCRIVPYAFHLFAAAYQPCR
jgi:hypothetical protein